MPFLSTALGIGALLGGASSAGSAIASGSMNRKNRKWQEKMYKQQVADQRENAQWQWDKSREYAEWSYKNFESPNAQRAANKAAGINPFFDGSAIQSMGATQGAGSAPESGSVPSHGPYQNNPMSNIQAGASSLREAAMQNVQAQNIQAQTEYTNAQRLKTMAETKGLENANSLFDIVKATAESDLVSKRFRNVLDEVQARLAEANAIADLDQKRAKVAEIWSQYESNLASAAKTDADRMTVELLRDGQKRAQEAGISLIEAQTQTEGAKQANLASDTDLKRAQSETENALRDGRVRLTSEQANKVVRDVFGAEISNQREAAELARVLSGTEKSSSMWSLFDKILDTKLRGITGPRASELRDEYYRRFISTVAGDYVSLSGK
ncbi:hypothetical protein KG007_00610 [Alistipes sp. kh20]|uniref:hypothetical protein n=1 Tax=Alistipes montrealensis TaxID=2834113 RepID=UPI001BCAF827|nr:hypothetical protein [Alistipes montrealensis]MBS4764708.1 hypothetical protein [Alistipes montrealensis]